ncbi:MAG TPA: hypothetical protein VGH33_03975 [Isosphaeraceae bacterium]|jgi:hypothetical protein
MKRTAVLVAAFACCAAGSAYALYSISDRGTWPASWPKELEPLRKQSRTAVGPTVPQEHYDIPFSNRKEFEAAWPHLLRVKSPGAPIILLRGPDTWLGKAMGAGVRVHCPPAGTDKRVSPETPIPGVQNVGERWMRTNYIELVVDGAIVDLNRIPLPADTPIIDERAKVPEPGR